MSPSITVTPKQVRRAPHLGALCCHYGSNLRNGFDPAHKIAWARPQITEGPGKALRPPSTVHAGGRPAVGLGRRQAVLGGAAAPRAHSPNSGAGELVAKIAPVGGTLPTSSPAPEWGGPG